MAKFNEILVGRFNRALQKLTAMKGGPPSAQLSTEITSNIQFNQMGADFRYLEGWMRHSWVQAPGAFAGQQSCVRLRNPAASNIIAVFERIVATAPTALADNPQLQHQQSNADLAQVAFTQQMRWDPRGNIQSGLIASVNNAGNPAVAFLIKEFGAYAAGTAYKFIEDFDHQLTLLPGDAIQVQSNVVNQNIEVSFLWRERFLEDSERS